MLRHSPLIFSIGVIGLSACLEQSNSKILSKFMYSFSDCDRPVVREVDLFLISKILFSRSILRLVYDGASLYSGLLYIAIKTVPFAGFPANNDAILLIVPLISLTSTIIIITCV